MIEGPNVVCLTTMASREIPQDENLVQTERKLLSALNNLPPMPDLSKHFNTFNGKIIALLVVVGFIIYHSILLGTLGKINNK